MKNNTKGIGFKNFRRFENFPLLEFGNITYMVGRNNSGKSTMVKALLLVIDYLQNQLDETFSFDNKVLEDANIVTFGRAKCNLIDEPEIVFSYKLNNYDITVHISGDDLSTKASVNKIDIKEPSNTFEFTIDYLEGMVKFVKKSNKKIMGGVDFTLDDMKYHKSINMQLDELRRQYRNIKSHNKGSKEALDLSVKINKLDKQIKKIDKLRAIPRKPKGVNTYYNVSYSLDAIFGGQGLYKNEENPLFDIISRFKHLNEINAKKSAREVKPNNLADVVALNLDSKAIYNFQTEIINKIGNERYFYLGANPSKQSALFPLRAKGNALAQAIHQFYQLNIIKGENEHEFVKYWMNEFEVGQSFEIKFYAGEAYEFHVEDEHGIKNHLSDKGMGSLQAMVLILNVASLIRINKKQKKNITLLIEEPELNLHPDLQSKLTVFFHNVNKEYGFDFIIETHSEYMVRKAQLIAIKQDYIKNQEINPNPFKVFYFHKEQGPYELKIISDGMFDRDFGNGFFNVIDDIALDIFLLNNSKE